MGLGITGFLSFFPGVDSVLRGASPGSKLLAPGPSLEPTAGSWVLTVEELVRGQGVLFRRVTTPLKYWQVFNSGHLTI